MTVTRCEFCYKAGKEPIEIVVPANAGTASYWAQKITVIAKEERLRQSPNAVVILFYLSLRGV
jgi:hypothetical protein